MIMGACISQQPKKYTKKGQQQFSKHKANQPKESNIKIVEIKRENIGQQQNYIQNDHRLTQDNSPKIQQNPVPPFELIQTLKCEKWKRKPKQQQKILNQPQLSRRRKAQKNIQQILSQSLLLRNAYQKVSTQIQNASKIHSHF